MLGGGICWLMCSAELLVVALPAGFHLWVQWWCVVAVGRVSLRPLLSCWLTMGFQVLLFADLVMASSRFVDSSPDSVWR
ncbi:hypothetical protein Droror1_Dr00024291 [Drosera rotundifolia]